MAFGEAGAQAPAGAPDTAAPAGPPAARSVSGSVSRPVGREPGDVAPVSGAWVTLHRVGGGSAGPVDSTRSGAGGAFTIRYQRPPSESDVYFLSTSYGGITYFSAPLPNADVSGEDADLVVYDTTSAALPVRSQARHLVVGAIDSTGLRPIVEVWELANDTSLTLVARDDRPSWTTAIPPQARDFRAVGSEVSPDAVTRDGAEVRVFAPLAPGTKTVSFAYGLPADVFPLTQPVGRDSVQMLEVLIEDPAGTVDGAKLVEGEPLDVDGRRFRRFVAAQVPPSAVMRITLPAPPVNTRRAYVTAILVAIGLLMLLALARSVRRPPSPALGWNGAEGPSPEELARRIATLDAAFQKRRAPSVEERQEYERQRGGLKAQLTDALQRRDA